MKVNPLVVRIPLREWDGSLPVGYRHLRSYSGYAYLAPRHPNIVGEQF